MLECARRTAIVLGIFLNGSFAMDVPQIADSRHLDVMSGLMLSNDPIQFLATVTLANVGKRNSIVRTENSCVGDCLRDNSGPDQCRRSGQESPAVRSSF